MNPIQLFFGLPLDPMRYPLFCKAFDALASKRKERFFSPHPEAAMVQLEPQGSKPGYIGKNLGSHVDPATLQQLQEHLHSIMRLMLPDFAEGFPPAELFVLQLPL